MPNTRFKKKLDAAARGGVAAAHKCRLLAAQHGGIHVLVEGGDDQPYYRPFIAATYNTANIWFHMADGRQEVLLARSIIPRNFTLAKKVLCIVDRDFDDVLSAPPVIPVDIFVTCYYSVESYFLSEEALRALFVTHGNLDWSSQFATELRASFQSFLDQASLRLRVVMAIAIAARDKGLLANLNNVKFSQLFAVDHLGQLSAQSKFVSTFVRQANIDPRAITRSDIRRAMKALRGKDSRVWIRGKYLLALFAEFVRANYRVAYEEKRARNPEFRHARTRVAITPDELMGICSGHLPCPESFSAYMASV